MITKEKINYKCSLPLKYSVDVLIVGGCPAGVAAALVAAREGLKTMLIEAHTCLGGAGTAGLVPAFMSFTDGVNFLAGGIGKEILETLQLAGGTFPKSGLAIRAEVLKRVYEKLLAESEVKFIYHTKLIDVIYSRRWH